MMLVMLKMLIVGLMMLLVGVQSLVSAGGDNHSNSTEGTLSVFACLEVMTGGVSQFLLAGQSSFVIPAGVCLL